MKRFINQIFFLSILFLFMGLFVFSYSAFAQSNYSSGNTVLLSREQVINSDYFSAGNTVLLDGTVNGDAYLAGGTIIINGTVHGDVLATGGNISINGKVIGNVRTIGGQVIISGEVGGNVTTAGGTITLQNPAKIAGSLVAVGGTISLLTPIGKGATIAGGQVDVDRSIGGDVTGAFGRITLLPQADIMGNFTYWSNNKAQIAYGAKIKEHTVYHKTNWGNQTAKQNGNAVNLVKGALTGFGIIWIIISLLTAGIIGLVLVTFLPIFTQDIVETMMNKPWLSLGIGFLTVIFFPFTILILFITILGIPFALMLLFAFIIFALLNWIFIAIAIGKKLLPKKRLAGLLLGLIIYEIVTIIPIIGWIVNTIALFIGIGAIILVEKKVYLLARDKKII